MNLSSIAAVFSFEWRRAFTWARMIWWMVLALFPGFIVGMVRFSLPHSEQASEPWIVMLFALIPMLVSMLGTFLLATPVVSAELERKSWVYLAVRPHGKVNLLLGKYLVAVTWALSAALAGLCVTLAIIPRDEVARIGGVIASITLLSCPAYAALYLLLGALFPKRSMVIAVAYTLVFELIISFIPAIINTLTVQYRIRTLLFIWSKFNLESDGPNFMEFVGGEPAWEHVVILLAYTLVLVVAAIGVVRSREFSVAEEGEG